MIISEQQILKLMEYLMLSIQGSLTDAGVERAEILIDQIKEQQSEELKVIE